MRALGKEVIEELIMNLKDAGCDEDVDKIITVSSLLFIR